MEGLENSYYFLSIRYLLKCVTLVYTNMYVVGYGRFEHFSAADQRLVNCELKNPLFVFIIFQTQNVYNKLYKSRLSEMN